MWNRWSYEALGAGQWAVLDAAGNVAEVCTSERAARVTAELRNERLARQGRYDGAVH